MRQGQVSAGAVEKRIEEISPQCRIFNQIFLDIYKNEIEFPPKERKKQWDRVESKWTKYFRFQRLESTK